MTDSAEFQYSGCFSTVRQWPGPGGGPLFLPCSQVLLTYHTIHTIPYSTRPALSRAALSRAALEPLDLSLLDLGTGPSPRRFCGRNRSKPRLAGKLSGRLLRRRPRTRTCPAPTRPVVEQVACSTRDGDALEGVGEFCYRDQLPVGAGQRPLSTAWPPSARPRGRDRAAGRRTVGGGMCLMSSAACSSIACASQPVAALGTASSSPSSTALW